MTLNLTKPAEGDVGWAGDVNQNFTDIENGINNHHAQHVSGGSDAFTSSEVIEAIAKRLRETGGPTNLDLGAVSDGQVLARSGATLAGVSSVTPTAHAASHKPAASDAIDWAGSILMSGTLAARPAAAAGNEGCLYFATDDSGGTLYRSTGAAWTQLARGVTQAPPAHASSHNAGGSDALVIDAAAGTGSLRTLGTGGLQACPGNDARLSDSRTPTGSAGGDLSGTFPNPTIASLAVTAAKIANSTITDGQVAAANKDGAAGTASMRTLGTGSAQACAGNDSRLSDARTPTTHATSHKNGGGDEVATATAAANAIPKAGAGGTLATGWYPDMVGDSGSGGTKGAVPAPASGDAAAGKFLKADGTWAAPSAAGTSVYTINGFRLTTESGTPVSTSDRTSQGTIYLTPYVSNEIWTYDSSVWTRHAPTSGSPAGEISLALTATSGKNYDVFVYWTGSGLALELSSAWTSDTARNDAIAQQDGVWVKSSDHSRRFVGTIRASGTNVTEDSASIRGVWNVANRVRRDLYCQQPDGSWSYTSATWRAANANVTYGQARVGYVCGLDEDLVEGENSLSICNSSGSWSTGIGVGVDSTSTNSAKVYGTISSNAAWGHDLALYRGRPGIGYHYLQMIENTYSGTTYYYATWSPELQGGMTAEVLA